MTSPSDADARPSYLLFFLAVLFFFFFFSSVSSVSFFLHVAPLRSLPALYIKPSISHSFPRDNKRKRKKSERLFAFLLSRVNATLEAAMSVGRSVT